MRISLTAEDFAALVAGRIIKKKQTVDVPGGGWGQSASVREVEVEICLQDIGLGKMAEALEKARQG